MVKILFLILLFNKHYTSLKNCMCNIDNKKIYVLIDKTTNQQFYFFISFLQ